MSPAAHTIAVTLTEDGKLTLDHLPFRAGQAVEVVVQMAPPYPPLPDVSPLKGTVLKYDDPFEPACPPEDWEALR